MLDTNNRFREMRRSVLDIIGDTPGAEYNLDNTRKYPYVKWRQIIAYMLANEGYTITEISHVMNKSHGTISLHVATITDIVRHPLRIDRDIILMIKSLKNRLYGERECDSDNIVVTTVGVIRTALLESGLDEDASRKAIIKIKNN